MPQRLFVLIPVFLFISVIDCKWSLLSAFSMFRGSQTGLKLPKHTPYPEVEDETSFKLLVTGLGLVYESFDVVTVDGYVLNLNRIVNPKLKDKPKKGPPILMVNGLMMHSEAWLVHGNPRHNVAIAWLEAGYDVWMGDQRGTLRSRRHVLYNDQERLFWDFTFHEVGVYDLPAFIDYILGVTKYPKLVYSGLSLGCTFFFVMCSERPQYQQKIYGSVQFVPVGIVPFVHQMSPQSQVTITTVETLMTMCKSFGVMYITDLPLLKASLVTWCNVTVDLWMLSFDFTLGPGGNYDRDDFCYQVGLPFGGTSIITVLHTIQLYRTGKFQRYDYGVLSNLNRYGSTHPPFYDFKRIWAPTAVYYSDIDVFAPGKHVEQMMAEFSGPTYGCVMKGMNHIGPGVDSRIRYYLPDLVDIVNSMTGRSNSATAFDGRTSCPANLSTHGQ